ncbi:MAG: hypothetical protein ACR2LK_06900, partial [Solirubrobacteraceae bacterium]
LPPFGPAPATRPREAPAGTVVGGAPWPVWLGLAVFGLGLPLGGGIVSARRRRRRRAKGAVARAA